VNKLVKETISFERGKDPKKQLKVGIENWDPLRDTEIFDIVDEYFDEAENYVISNFPEFIGKKSYDRIFNDYIRKKDIRLENDKRNFYKIYWKYGPQ
jgi:hypothetical protein